MRFLLFSATRKMAECPEYAHVVPNHPPLCDLSVFDAEHRAEIKSRFATRRWKWTHCSLLRALVRSPCSDEIALGDQKLNRLDRIGENRCILPQKFLDLIEITSCDTRRCFAMTDDIRRNEVVKRIRLTAVQCI